jgi:hypothetical protein
MQSHASTHGKPAGRACAILLSPLPSVAFRCDVSLTLSSGWAGRSRARDAPLPVTSYDDSNSSRFPKRELAVRRRASKTAGASRDETAGQEEETSQWDRSARSRAPTVPIHHIIYVPIIHPSAAPVSLRAYPSTPSRRGSGANLFQVLGAGHEHTHMVRVGWMIGPLELDA